MLTIGDYKNWAANDQRTAVALNDGGTALVSESNQMCGAARAFCRGAVKKMRGDVLADFTRALSVRYGESIAREAVSMAGLLVRSLIERLEDHPRHKRRQEHPRADAAARGRTEPHSRQHRGLCGERGRLDG